MQYYKKAAVDERSVYMESRHPLPKLKMVYFLLWAKAYIAVISFAPRMIAVIFKMLLQCGEIRTRYSQDATITRNWLKRES